MSNADFRHYEDFTDDFRFEFQVPGPSEEDIVAFAREYDPQRFHLSEADAAATHFGRLCASGFQTQLLCFRPFCERVLVNSRAVGSPGIDNLKWLSPWYVGEELHGVVVLTGKRASAKKADRGYVSFQLDAWHEQHAVVRMSWTVMFQKRPRA